MPSTVTMRWSAIASTNIAHFDAQCPGLERVAAEHVRRVRANVSELVPSGRRPCRICALETVAVQALGSNRTPSHRRTLVTFSSQPAIGVDQTRFRANTITDTGIERLHRIALRAGLETTTTVCGPVAYGFSRHTTPSVIGQSLRCAFASPGLFSALPEPATIATFWTFLDDEQRGYSDDDAWTLTAAICPDPAFRKARPKCTTHREPTHQ
jgi:hypothetical protein